MFLPCCKSSIETKLISLSDWFLQDKCYFCQDPMQYDWEKVWVFTRIILSYSICRIEINHFCSENNFCKKTVHYDWEIYLCHAALARLSLVFSDNNFCKVELISVKSGCIMTEEKYVFSHICCTAAAELRQSALFSEINSSRYVL